jgi:NitT/TauT family transport system permease protein
LRAPSALPYIFTALKIAATASVVGAIIGELPSGIRDGLGGAILNFNSYYISGPARLWAAIVVSAFVGIGFFLIISLAERLVLRGRFRAVDQ